MAIKIEVLEDDRIHTYSDQHLKIRQVDTGIIYEDAIDSVVHAYEETDEPIEENELPEDLSEDQGGLE